MPDAVDGVDGVERRVRGEKLAADALDVRGDGAVVHHQVGVTHQLLPALHVLGKLGERVHHPELGERELDRLLAPVHAEALQVERERAALEALGRGCGLA